MNLQGEIVATVKLDDRELIFTAIKTQGKKWHGRLYMQQGAALTLVCEIHFRHLGLIMKGLQALRMAIDLDAARGSEQARPKIGTHWHEEYRVRPAGTPLGKVSP